MNESKISHTVTLVNTLSVDPANVEKLLEILKKGAEEIMAKQKGYISSVIYKSKDKKSVVILAKWQSLKDIEDVRNNPKNTDYLKSIQSIASANPSLYEEYLEHSN